MAKLTRQTMKWFGSNVGATDIGIFGSLAAGSPTYSTVIATIQSLPHWSTGWAAETIGAWRPALEDMNALCYVLSYGVSYVHEMGICEYDAGTIYYQNSYCQVAGVVYYSLQDNNIGNAPASSPAYWAVGIQGVNSVPSGGIIMWSGSIASIPTGWYLCDGNNGTPNLRDRFVIGAGSSYAVGASGGSTTKNLSHNHTGATAGATDTGGGSQYMHTGTVSTELSATQDVLNPYYALAFIQKA